MSETCHRCGYPIEACVCDSFPLEYEGDDEE